MRVVSDADVVIHLSNLDKLSLLEALYNEVAIPEYVKSEVLHKDNPAISQAVNSFLKVFTTDEDSAKGLASKHGIHLGEAHVKLLGELLKARLFLSNERKVREAAKEEGFVVTGTIGIILKAVKKSLIDKAEATFLFERMKTPDFRIHPDILQTAINVLAEM